MLLGTATLQWAVGSGTRALHCNNARRSGLWHSCWALPHYRGYCGVELAVGTAPLGAVGSGTPVGHCHTATSFDSSRACERNASNTFNVHRERNASTTFNVHRPTTRKRQVKADFHSAHCNSSVPSRIASNECAHCTAVSSRRSDFTTLPLFAERGSKHVSRWGRRLQETPLRPAAEDSSCSHC
jgi:hypothetical protein